MRLLNFYGGDLCAKVGLLLFICVMSFQAKTQCPGPSDTFGCNNVQVSLNETCEAVITPDLVLSSQFPGCDFFVNILDRFDRVILSTTNTGTGFIYPVLGASQVGESLRAEVFYFDENNTRRPCWGDISVEDKIPPRLTCMDDITVDCKDDLSDLFTSTSTVSFCSEFFIDPAAIDLDNNPLTYTLPVFPQGTSSFNPWELISDFIPTSMVTFTGSGTGSGTISIGGMSHMATLNPDGSIDFPTLFGMSTNDVVDPVLITLVVDDFPTGVGSQICFDLGAESFGTFVEGDNCSETSSIAIVRDELDQSTCGVTEFTARRVIEYVAVDQSGLTSDTCRFDIFFSGRSVDDVVFPPNVELQCSDNIDLSTLDTGRPQIDGCDIDLGDNLCRINISFVDDTISSCGNNPTITRKWTALDWCGGEFNIGYQTISVVDNLPPTFTCPADGMVFLANSGCSTVVSFDPLSDTAATGANVSDCSAVEVSAYYSLRGSSSFEPIGSNLNALLETGMYTIRYEFSDVCGNTSQCEFDIDVQDNTPPIPVCDQFTAVALADNGWGRLFAISLDDGSYDECGGDVTLDVRRLDSPCAAFTEYDRDDTEFGPFVQFCCAEGGSTVPVEMRVTDAGGRSNTCTVSVEVQDKVGLTTTNCPLGNPTISCGDSVSPDELGRPQVDTNCTVVDEVFFVDNDSGIADDCGEGSIIRTWSIRSNGQVIGLPACRQVITVQNGQSFSNNSFVFPPDNNNATCSNFGDATVVPTIGGVPVNEAGGCSQLAFSFTDNIFNNVEGACFKVIRTWTVIDWCTFDPVTNPNEGIFTNTQILEVSDSEGPEIISCPDDLVVDATNDGCSADVFFPMPSANDLCFDEPLGSSAFSHVIRSGSGAIVATGEGAVGLISDLVADTYTVTWTIVSRCGNADICAYDVTIIDNINPTPYCRSTVTTVITGVGDPSNPTVEVWASDFVLDDSGPLDNCDTDVAISFSGMDLSDTRREFNCTQLGFHTLNVWFTDNSGNQDFCTVNVNIQVNSDVCDQIGSSAVVNVGGQVFTEDERMIEDVNVGLQSMTSNDMNLSSTDINGRFAFDNIIGNDDYRLGPNSNSDYLNGISTLDLVMIQRHILGIAPLDSPYKIIAADINNSQTINGLDLLELRKLILGVYSELPQNESWRFVDEEFEFTNTLSPWPFNEVIEFYNVTADNMDNNFVAVKIGDVNNSAVVNNVDSDNGSVGSLKLQQDLLDLESNNEYLVPITGLTDFDLSGFQLGFTTVSHDIVIKNIESGKINIEEYNFAVSDNQLLLSWNSENPIQIEEGQALFYITVQSTVELTQNPLRLSNGLSSELYSTELDVSNIELTSDSNNNVVLYQNNPNPFNDFTIIQFELPAQAKAELKIIDINGKLVKSYVNQFSAGLNSVTIDYSQLQGSGVYYYQLSAGDYTSTKKMILVE